MRKRIITIAGFPGSGKSSTAKEVSRRLGYRHFSSGDMFRKMAAERGLTVEEINFAAEKQKEIDLMVDELLKKMGEEENDIVIDSRTAFHWMPDSFKVYLDISPEVAAERTFAHIQKEGRTSQTAASVEEVLKKTEERRASERKRYQNLYGLDVTDKSQFDLVINTEVNDLEKVSDMVVANYENWLNDK